MSRNLHPASQVRSVLFFVLCLLCLAPLAGLPAQVMAWTAPTALVAGTVLALTVGHPYADKAKGAVKWLLQGSVVLLGFSMEIGKVAEAGRSGLAFSFVSIAFVFLLGWGLQRVIKVGPITGLLVSAGTAICGGSAIAAVGLVVDAKEEDMSVAVGTVFLLNALALLVFPPLGHILGLTQRQFGVWAGISVHDIASVVGAGTAYGPESLDVGTAVKLSRVLYLVPVTLIVAWVQQRSTKTENQGMQFPWFVGLFLLASFARGVVPGLAEHGGDVKRIASSGFALCLFLIGTALTRATLRSVGVRPLLLGALLWITISMAALAVVRFG